MDLLPNSTITKRVIEWARQRDILTESTPAAQVLKLVEELGEVMAGIKNECCYDIEDGIGDSLVVITILAAQLRLDAESIINTPVAVLSADNHNEFFIEDLFINVAQVCAAIAKNKTETTNMTELLGKVVESIGYVAQATTSDTNYCYNTAWTAIRYRKGKMINGVFVKSEDLA